MTPQFIVFLSGLFVVPIVLLAWGHRLRRRSLRQQNAFWGAIAGHCIAGLVAVTFGMIPPEAWTDGETVRGFLGLWSMVVFPVVGAIIGALRVGQSHLTRSDQAALR